MAAETAPFVIFGLFGLLILFIISLVLASTIFWIWMIVDCAQRKMKDNDKVVWILVLIFLGILGAIVYYFVIKRKN